jgi:hypothetical protein
MVPAAMRARWNRRGRSGGTSQRRRWGLDSCALSGKGKEVRRRRSVHSLTDWEDRRASRRAPTSFAMPRLVGRWLFVGLGPTYDACGRLKSTSQLGAGQSVPPLSPWHHEGGRFFRTRKEEILPQGHKQAGHRRQSGARSRYLFKRGELCQGGRADSFPSAPFSPSASHYWR